MHELVVWVTNLFSLSVRCHASTKNSSCISIVQWGYRGAHAHNRETTMKVNVKTKRGNQRKYPVLLKRYTNGRTKVV